MEEETKNSKALKKSEKSHFALGRLYCFSAFVEALPQDFNGEDLAKKMANQLMSTFNHNEGLRQGVISLAQKFMSKLDEETFTSFVKVYFAPLLNEKNQLT
jgi:hypothetical protein